MIYELVIPGLWLDYGTEAWVDDVDLQIALLKECFFCANASLIDFKEEQAKHLCRMRNQLNPEEILADLARRREIADTLMRSSTAPFNDNYRDEIDLRATAEFHREQWAKGKTPQTIARQRLFIYARSFIQVIDMIEKLLSVLQEIGAVSHAAKEGRDQLLAVFPDLRGVRNSVQHIEDRSRRLGSRKKPLDLKAVDNGMVSAPAGKLLILSNLSGSRFGCTMADGHYGEIDISDASMVALQGVMQDFLNSLRWKGEKKFEPT